MAFGLTQWLGLDGNWCMRDTLTSPFSLKEEALPVYKETITKDTVVLKGLSI